MFEMAAQPRYSELSEAREQLNRRLDIYTQQYKAKEAQYAELGIVRKRNLEKVLRTLQRQGKLVVARSWPNTPSTSPASPLFPPPSLPPRNHCLLSQRSPGPRLPTLSIVFENGVAILSRRHVSSATCPAQPSILVLPTNAAHDARVGGAQDKIEIEKIVHAAIPQNQIGTTTVEGRGTEQIQPGIGQSLVPICGPSAGLGAASDGREQRAPGPTTHAAPARTAGPRTQVPFGGGGATGVEGGGTTRRRCTC